MSFAYAVMMRFAQSFEVIKGSPFHDAAKADNDFYHTCVRIRTDGRDAI